MLALTYTVSLQQKLNVISQKFSLKNLLIGELKTKNQKTLIKEPLNSNKNSSLIIVLM